MADEGTPSRQKVTLGLSARLLLLTAFFVMLSEFLIYAPSISRFRHEYLNDRIARAHLATQTLEATPDAFVSRDVERALLFHAEAYGIVLRYPDQHVLMLSEDMPPKVDVMFDMRMRNYFTWMEDAFEALFQDENRIMRVIGPSPKEPDVLIDVVMDEAPMVRQMIWYSNRILQLSIVISLVTAVLVYLSLQWLLVRPMRGVTESMIHFRADPEDVARTIHPSGRSDEIGVAQRELFVMQNEVRTALQQKSRLATLGAAVAKVNHDLRNSLSTAVLVSDRLADIDDPEVKKVTPRLFEAIDRAVMLCSQTLNYVADTTPKLRFGRFSLAGLVEEVGESLTGGEDGVGMGTWLNKVDNALEVEADREQLFRVLTNLGQNAFQAGAKNVTVSASPADGKVSVRISDDGPGLPAKARKNLFQPFVSSVRAGGSGLGLVIVRDIMRAHGGDVVLVDSGPAGTTFAIDLRAPSPSARAAE
jgi:signal transduction histidine kinase